MRFELTTLTLARLCSTPELRPHSVSVDVVYKRLQAAARGKIAGGKDRRFASAERVGPRRVGVSSGGQRGRPIAKEIAMKGVLAWAIGLPIPIIILLYLFGVF